MMSLAMIDSPPLQLVLTPPAAGSAGPQIPAAPQSADRDLAAVIGHVHRCMLKLQRQRTTSDADLRRLICDHLRRNAERHRR